MVFLMLNQEYINYQAVVRDNSGNIVSETNVPVIITLSDGSNEYKEDYSATTAQIETNKFGLINLVIGQGSVTSTTYIASVSGTFSSLD